MMDSSLTLVTGATGLLGSELVQQLVSGGVSVRIFRRETSDVRLLGAAASEVDHAVGDVTDARSVRRAMEGVGRVYHAAARVRFGPGEREALRRVNVGGTANVVNAALDAGVDRILHVSSMAAFGRPTGTHDVSTNTHDASTSASDASGARRDAPGAVPVIDERTSWDGKASRSAYATSKYESELEMHRGIAEGIDAVIVNPSLIFGVGREGENTRRIVDAVRSGWARAVPPGRTNVVDVKDVATGMRRAMQHGETGRRYFLGSENLSWNDIVGTLAHAFGQRPPAVTLPPFAMQAAAMVAEAVSTVTRTQPVISREQVRTSTSSFAYSNQRAQAELGMQFRPFTDTARRIAASLLQEHPTP